MLKDAPVIILDEATASVDPENERQLQEAFEALTRDKTVIMIAHRLSTVRKADQILVLDKGGSSSAGGMRSLWSRAASMRTSSASGNRLSAGRCEFGQCLEGVEASPPVSRLLFYL